MKAVWKNQVIAESSNVIFLEGNAYFPVESLNKKFLKRSDFTSMCPWKGKANYLTIVVGGEENQNSIWYYNNPPEKAEMIRNRVAFWNGVEISE